MFAEVAGGGVCVVWVGVGGEQRGGKGEEATLAGCGLGKAAEGTRRRELGSEGGDG